MSCEKEWEEVEARHIFLLPELERFDGKGPREQTTKDRSKSVTLHNLPLTFVLVHKEREGEETPTVEDMVNLEGTPKSRTVCKSDSKIEWSVLVRRPKTIVVGDGDRKSRDRDDNV